MYREQIADQFRPDPEERPLGQPLTWLVERRELLSLIGDFADQIHKLHEAGFVHGDLKPANILIGEGGVRTIDSLQLKPGDQSTAMTPSWAAPEQLLGACVLSATDQWIAYMRARWACGAARIPAQVWFWTGSHRIRRHPSCSGTRQRRAQGVVSFPGPLSAIRSGFEIPHDGRSCGRTSCYPQPPSGSRRLGALPEFWSGPIIGFGRTILGSGDLLVTQLHARAALTKRAGWR